MTARGARGIASCTIVPDQGSAARQAQGSALARARAGLRGAEVRCVPGEPVKKAGDFGCGMSRLLNKFVYITDGAGIQQDKFSWERDEGSNIVAATLIHTTYVLLLAWLFKMQSVAHKQGSLFAPRFHATSKHTWTVLLLQFYRDAV